jgi:hypothetical protein
MTTMAALIAMLIDGDGWKLAAIKSGDSTAGDGDTGCPSGLAEDGKAGDVEYDRAGGGQTNRDRPRP